MTESNQDRPALPLPDPKMGFDQIVEALGATVVEGDKMDGMVEWFFRKSRYARHIDKGGCDGRIAFVGPIVILEHPDTDDSAGGPPWIYVMDPKGGSPSEFSPNY